MQSLPDTKAPDSRARRLAVQGQQTACHVLLTGWPGILAAVKFCATRFSHVFQRSTVLRLVMSCIAGKVRSCREQQACPACNTVCSCTMQH